MTPTTCFRLLLAEISLYRDQRERELSRRLTFSSPSGGDQFISKAFDDSYQRVWIGFRLLLAEISLYHNTSVDQLVNDNVFVSFWRRSVYIKNAKITIYHCPRVFVSFWRRSVYISTSTIQGAGSGGVFVSFWRRSVYISSLG